MVTEDFVSYETAKLLKEKGFEGRMHTFYTEEGTEIESSYVVPSNFFPIYRPTLQMTMKWLREVYNITIGITFSYGIISYEIQKNGEFITSIGSSRTYEQMVEEAIQLCVKTLI